MYLNPRNGPSESSVSSSADVEPSVLEIAAQQMRRKDRESQKEWESNEESTIYSQAIHYANRMVYLLIPLEAGQSTSIRSVYSNLYEV